MDYDKYVGTTFEDIREHLFDFREDAIVEAGLKDHPKAFRVFNMAWAFNEGPSRMFALNPTCGSIKRSAINDEYKALLRNVVTTMGDLASLILED